MIKITRECESLPMDFKDLGFGISKSCFVVCACSWPGSETHPNGNYKRNLILLLPRPQLKKIGRQIFSQLKIYFSNLPKSTKEILITLMFSAYYYNKYTSFYYNLTAPWLHTTNDDYLFSI